MPGNNQPMQCGNSSINDKVLKKKGKLSCNGRLLEEIRGCAIGQRAEGCRGGLAMPGAAALWHNPAFRCSVYQGSIS